MGNLKDFATGTVAVAPSPASAGTTLEVQAGEGDRLPNEFPFYVTAHPDGEFPTLDNAEKLQVTAKTGDELTIVRAQGDTSAQSIAVDWRISNAIFEDDLVGQNSFIFHEVPTGSVNGSNVDFVAANEYIVGSLHVYVNGLLQAAAHVTEDNPALGEFSLDVAPETGDVLEIAYQTLGNSSGNADTVDGYHAASLLPPVGMVTPFAGASAPTGWLMCYGQAISRTDYADLFTVIGTTYGSGDGSTTFNVPDIRGRAIAGQDDMGGSSANRLTTPIDGDTLGAVGGAESTLTPNHSHTLSNAGQAKVEPTSSGNLVAELVATASWNSNERIDAASNASNPTGRLLGAGLTGSTDSGGAGSIETLQPTIILNYMIRAL